MKSVCLLNNPQKYASRSPCSVLVFVAWWILESRKCTASRSHPRRRVSVTFPRLHVRVLGSRSTNVLQCVCSELGYALAVSFGAVMDNPDLVVTCVVGDGEAETGPTATAWHSYKFIDPRESGAVCPLAIGIPVCLRAYRMYVLLFAAGRLHVEALLVYALALCTCECAGSYACCLAWLACSCACACACVAA